MPAYSGTRSAISARSARLSAQAKRSARSGRTRDASSAKIRHSLRASPSGSATCGLNAIWRSVVVLVPPPSCS